MFVFSTLLASVCCVGILKNVFKREADLYKYSGNGAKTRCEKGYDRYYTQYIDNGTCTFRPETMLNIDWKYWSVLSDDLPEYYKYVVDGTTISVINKYYRDCDDDTAESDDIEHYTIGTCYLYTDWDGIETYYQFEFGEVPILTDKGYSIHYYLDAGCTGGEDRYGYTEYYENGYGCYNETTEDLCLEGECNPFTTKQRKIERDGDQIFSYGYVPVDGGSLACFEKVDTDTKVLISEVGKCNDLDFMYGPINTIGGDDDVGEAHGLELPVRFWLLVLITLMCVGVFL